MRMKYFQAIADIRNHYDEILRCIENVNQWGSTLLESWNIPLSEKDDLWEEREVLRYLLSCHLSFAREKNVTKPTLEAVQRVFHRHLSFLEKIHGCHAYNVNQHSSKLIQKEYKACRHYLFQFSLPTWYHKLPNEILTLEHKYPKTENEANTFGF